MFKDGGREFHSITNSGDVVEKKREIVEIVVSLWLEGGQFWGWERGNEGERKRVSVYMRYLEKIVLVRRI